MQDILPTTAQHDDVAVSEFEKYLRVKDIHGAEEFVSHSFKDIQNANLCTVRQSVTRWPPLAVQFKPHPWTVWAGMVAECLSSQRTLHFRFKRCSSAHCGIRWRLTAKPCSAANGEQYRYEIQKMQSPSPQADIHKSCCCSRWGYVELWCDACRTL